MIPDKTRRSLSDSVLLRGSALLLVASLAGNTCAYAFNVVAGRVLGPDEYGSALALVATLSILAIPAISIQTMAAAEMSRALARGASEAQAEASSLHRLGLLLSVGVLAVFSLLAQPLGGALKLTFVPLLGVGVAAAAGILLGTLRGVIQGRRQFGTLGLALVAEPAVRLAALAFLLLGGVRLVAPIVAFLVGYAGVYLALLNRTVVVQRPPPSERASRARVKVLLPYTCALALATALYNVDVLAARATLSSTEAGLYSGGAVLGRAVYFLGASAGMALLPLIASAATLRVRLQYLLEALAFTAAVAGIPTIAYFLVPDTAIAVTFGASYEGLGPNLWLFGLSMLLYALANLAFSYLIALSRWIVILPLLAAALVQGAMLMMWHQDLRSIATVQVGVMTLANALVWPIVAAGLRKVPAEGAAGRAFRS